MTNHSDRSDKSSKAFGVWKERRIDSLAAEDKARKEWERENRIDLEAARAALGDKTPRVQWKRLKKELGLSK